MALTILDVSGRPKAPLAGDRSINVIEFTFDTDYQTGGYDLAAEDLGYSEVTFMAVELTGGYVPIYDRANEKLQVMFGNYDASDGPLIEVSAGENGIDTLTARALIIGVAA